MKRGFVERPAPWVAFVCGLLGVGCGDSDNHRACTVTQNGDGSATISCEDGTSATISSGEDGAQGQPGEDGAAGEDGDPGADGVPGTDGVPGDAGSSCTVVEHSDGGHTVSCADGTTAEIPHVVVGYGGAGGGGNEGSIFYGASSFTVAFADSQDPVAFSSTGDYAYIPDGEAPFYNFLLAPVRLPGGVEVRSMTCRYYDNTSLADLEADAALVEKDLDFESGIERIRIPMGASDIVSSQIQSETRPPDEPLLIDNDQNSYFLRIYWLTSNAGSSAVRFYGCGLDYGPPGD